MEGLPDEVCLIVFTRFLTADDVCNCARVCREWRRLADDQVLWKSLCLERWATKQFTATPDIEARGQQAGWKKTYGDCERDAERTHITESEIVNTKWRFRFMFWHPWRVCYPTFTADYRTFGYTIASGDYTWRLEDNGAAMCVDEYPPHSVERLPDWGWRMTNMAVEFVSVTDIEKDLQEQTALANAAASIVLSGSDSDSDFFIDPDDEYE